MLLPLAMLVGGYAALVGASKFGYRALLYPAPQRGLDVAPSGATLRTFETRDGTPVQALSYAASEGTGKQRTVVFFHGNGETIADSAGIAQRMTARGLGFVAVEYRGYGNSPARDPHEQGLYDDAEAVLTGLQREGLTPADTVLWGVSLGSGVAVEMATRGHGARLILSTPYTSIPDVAARVMPLLPMRLVIGDRFDSLSKAGKVNLPTLILHGDRDGVVPYDMGVTLSKAIAGAELITVLGGGHNDLFAREGERLFDAIGRHAQH
jgi:pimeloyl-ACP methyl ester carboxylesterase